jgi:hypothetical protein
VLLDAADEQVGGRLVAGRLGGLDAFRAAARERAVVITQRLGELQPVAGRDVRDRGRRRQRGEPARGILAQGAQALGESVGRVDQRLVLGPEGRVQGEELRPGQVPVRGMGLDAQGVGVGEEGAELGGEGRQWDVPCRAKRFEAGVTLEAAGVQRSR